WPSAGRTRLQGSARSSPSCARAASTDMNATTMRSSGVGAFVAMLWRRGAEHFAPPRVVTAAAASDVGTVRANNEDYFLMADLARPAFTVRGSEPHAALTSHGPLLVVADGMGGAAGGEVGSAMAG